MENKKGPLIFRTGDKELENIVSYDVTIPNQEFASRKYPYKHILEKNISKSDIRPYILHLFEKEIYKALRMKMNEEQFAIIKVEEYVAKKFKIQYKVVVDICEENQTFVG